MSDNKLKVANLTEKDLLTIYHTLLHHLGPSGWWPAETKPEIVIGAILTQNTSWKNVEKALDQVKAVTNFDPYELVKLPKEDLEKLIRPAGFYTNKAKAILEVLTWFNDHQWRTEEMLGHYQGRLRQALLALKGVGPETADDLLLYVFDQVTFVADTYSRRFFGRLLRKPFKTYDSLSRVTLLPETMTLKEAQDFHGQLDEWGKRAKEEQEALLDLVRRALVEAPN